ncbi:anti-sigma factor RsbA family regulatory protein [Streptomyces sp. NPDC047000]|uniref:anti-sigma factor RsbA family regulatory protein n=1 Tax=Streptomyces sp. NPDC047000 TaxID=3155474 RepID=UPI0033F9AAC5
MHAPDRGDTFDHPALFYRTAEEYLAGTVPFVRAGLAAGEPVAVAVPAENLRLLRAALGDDARAVRCLDMREAGRNPGRIIPGVLRAFADAQPAGRRVRIVGEPVWPDRTAAEYPACVQHEALINEAFRDRAVTILCPYDAGRLSHRALSDACTTHPAVVLPGTPARHVSLAYAPRTAAARCNLPLPPVPHAACHRFDADRLTDVRHLATDEGARLGLTGTRLQDLGLIIAELTANSVVHGGGSGTLRVWAEGAAVLCEVRDGGRLTDPLAGRRPAVPDRPGGRGLLLVNMVADLVRVHTGPHGTTVRCRLAVG